MIVELPQPGGRTERYELRPPPPPAMARPTAGATAPGGVSFNRLAYAAAHVVAAAPGSGRPPGAVAETVDWAATLRFRHHLWGLGFGVAEAMDTAQRDILGWEASSHLISLTLAEAALAPHRPVIAGAAVDHLPPAKPTIGQLVDGYLHQVEFIHQRGGRAILFPTAHLTRHYPEPRHFVEVYRAISRQVSKPVFVHWLGKMFAPALAGYFPGESFWEIMADNPNLLGVKVSLLDQETEQAIRRRLAPQGQVVLCGDDFNFPALIRGSETLLAETPFRFEGASFPMGDFSHALLGIFDGIATVAAQALAALAAGPAEEFSRLLAPTEPLSRHIFQPPTHFYKAGLVLLAYLNGHQPHPHLLGGLERERSLGHYVELFKLADRAGVLTDPPAAYQRLMALPAPPPAQAAP